MLSQSIKAELFVSMENVYVEASRLVHAVECVQFFDDVFCAIWSEIFCYKEIDLG